MGTRHRAIRPIAYESPTSVAAQHGARSNSIARLSNESELTTASPSDWRTGRADDVLVFISRRAIYYIRDGSHVLFHYRSDANRARLHDSRGRDTGSRDERD